MLLNYQKNCESCKQPKFVMYRICKEKFGWKCLKCGFGRIFTYLTIDDEVKMLKTNQNGVKAYV